tara:strand:- start:621 stop:1487 length:867 start_codon:yes stop_codon:yes gene_type:complete
MKNLVLGVSGRIGSYYLERSQNNFNIYSSRKKNNRKKIIKISTDPKIIERVLKINNISSVIIFTAISKPEDCKKNKKLSTEININFIKRLIKIFVKLNIYFIFFSSEYVYSGKRKSNIKYIEKSKISTRMIYGKQKIEIENFLHKIDYKNFSILRLAKTYGDILGDKTLFTSILQKYKKGIRKFKVASDQFFCPLFINDLIKIIDIFIKNKIRGTYNVCGDMFKSRYDFIKLMFKFFKIKDIELIKCSIKEFDDGIYYPKKLNLSNTKIKKKLKFKFIKLNNFFKKIK